MHPGWTHFGSLRNFIVLYKLIIIGCKTLNTFFFRNHVFVTGRSHISANFYPNNLNFGQNVYNKIVFSCTNFSIGLLVFKK